MACLEVIPVVTFFLCAKLSFVKKSDYFLPSCHITYWFMFELVEIAAVKIPALPAAASAQSGKQSYFLHVLLFTFFCVLSFLDAKEN